MAKGTLTVRIEDSIRGRLEHEAEGEGRSISNMLEKALRERYGAALAEREPKAGDAPAEPGTVAPSSPRSASAELSSGSSGATPRRSRSRREGANGKGGSPSATACEHPLHGRSGWKCPGCGEFKA